MSISSIEAMGALPFAQLEWEARRILVVSVGGATEPCWLPIE